MNILQNFEVTPSYFHPSLDPISLSPETNPAVFQNCLVFHPNSPMLCAGDIMKVKSVHRVHFGEGVELTLAMHSTKHLI